MNLDILKLLAILLKHSTEVPNLIAKIQAVASADGPVDKLSAAQDVLEALKPIAADLHSGGYMAVQHDEESLKAAFHAAGLGDIWAKLLELYKAHPEIFALILKLLFGIG